MYFPDRALSFYRVGFYDNILGGDRMSLYVEIGAPAGTALDVEAARARVLDDLAREGIVDGHQLVAWHTVSCSIRRTCTSRGARSRRPARVRGAARGRRRCTRSAATAAWTYCSIEDNMVETRALAARFAPLLG